MRRPAIAFLVALILLISLTGCGDSAKKSQQAKPASTSEQKKAKPPKKPNKKSEATPTPAPSSSPVKPTPSPEEKPSTPTPEPSRPAGVTPEPTPFVPQNQSVSPREIERGPAGTAIALTFDAGSSVVPTPKIMSALRDAGVGATFFLTGKWIEQNPGLATEIKQAGFEIGNHSYSHPDFATISDEAMTKEVLDTERLIQNAAGVSPKPYFRPPYGSRNAHVLGVLGSLGYYSIYWTVDALDWKTDMTPAMVESRVLDRVTGGAIVLMHCGSPQTAEILPDLIQQLKARGYRMVTLSELLK